MSDLAVDDASMQPTGARRGAMRHRWAIPLLLVAFAGYGSIFGVRVAREHP